MYSYVMYVCMIVCMDGIVLVLLEYSSYVLEQRYHS